MAGLPLRTSTSVLGPAEPSPVARSVRLRGMAVLLVLVPGAAAVLPPVLAGTSSGAPRMTSPGSRGPEMGSLLVVYYEDLLSDRNIGRFGQQVSARYSEGTLARLLDSGDVTARRASVVALGLCGT